VRKLSDSYSLICLNIQTRLNLRNLILCKTQSHAFEKNFRGWTDISKRAPNSSFGEWKCSEMKVTEEYCWVITQATGRSCCDRSGSSVLKFGFQLDSMYTYLVDRVCTQFRCPTNYRLVPILGNVALSRGVSVTGAFVLSTVTASRWSEDTVNIASTVQCASAVRRGCSLVFVRHYFQFPRHFRPLTPSTSFNFNIII